MRQKSVTGRADGWSIRASGKIGCRSPCSGSQARSAGPCYRDFSVCNDPLKRLDAPPFPNVTVGTRHPMKTVPAEPTRKSGIDALLLKLPGVVAKKLNGLDAYFVGDKMFACISGDGVGLRLPAATADALQFSRANVAHFQPGGLASTREWIQINRADPAEYVQDLDLFKASHAFVKAARSR